MQQVDGGLSSLPPCQCLSGISQKDLLKHKHRFTHAKVSGSVSGSAPCRHLSSHPTPPPWRATLATNGTTRTNFTVARRTAFNPACLMTIGGPSSRIGGVPPMIGRRRNLWRRQWRLTVTAGDGCPKITLMRPLVAGSGRLWRLQRPLWHSEGYNRRQLATTLAWVVIPVSASQRSLHNGHCGSAWH